MRLFVTLAVLFCITGQSRAAFLPNEYAIYQLSKIQSIDSAVTPEGTFWTAYVNPIRAEKITAPLLIQAIDTFDLNNDSIWAEGPGWVPADDSISHAFVVGTRPVYHQGTSYISYSFRPTPEYNVIAADIKFVSIPQVLAGEGLTFFRYSFSNRCSGRFSVTPEGFLAINGSSPDASFNDTIQTNIQTEKWIPFIVQFQTVGDDKQLVLFFGENEAFRKTIGPNPTQDSISVSLTSLRKTQVHVGSFAHFVGVTGDEVVKGYMQWEAAPGEGMCDTVVYPMYVHQILYDPPGDASSATIANDQTITSKFSFTVGGDLGINTMIGFEREFKTDPWGIGGKTGLDFELSASSKVSYRYGNEWTTTYNTSTTMSSSTEGTSSNYIGPGGGDIVAYQPFKLERKMYRRPKLGGGFNGDHDSTYVYYMFHRPIPDSNSYTRIARMEDLLRDLRDDTVAITILRNESAVDFNTGRIRPECLTSGRVVKLDENWDFSGNSPLKSSSSEKASHVESHSLSLTYSLNVKTKILISGVKFGAELSLVSTNGGSTSEGTVDSRTVSYTLSDNESWDNFAVSVYLDKHFGTYIFQVDSTISYSTFPYEDSYSRSGADFTLSVDTAQRAGSSGETLEYKVTILNTSPKLSDALTFTADMINFPHSAKVFPEEIHIAAGESAAFTVSLSAAEPGVFEAPLRTTLTAPGPRRTLSKEVVLRAVFTDDNAGIALDCSESFAHVQPGTLDAAHTFTIDITNIGGKSAVIDADITDASEGAKGEISEFIHTLPSGSTRQITVTVSGSGDHYPYSLRFRAQIEGSEESRREIVLTIDNTPPDGVHSRPPTVSTRPLDVLFHPVEGLRFSAPGNVPATVELFSPTGRLVYRKNFTGRGTLSCNGHPGAGLYIGRVRQGRKTILKPVRVTR